jgi:IMP dehydrogenase
MDTVTGETMAIHMALNGGLGIIHRFMSNQQQLDMLKKVKRYVRYLMINPYCVNSNDTIESLLLRIKERNVYTQCVVDNNKLVGLITNRDTKFINDEHYQESIKTIMTPLKLLHTLTISNIDEFNANIEHYLSYAQNLMKSNKVEKIPVINQNNELLGIITKRSIEYYFKNKKIATLDNYGRLCCGVAIGIKNIDWDYIDELINNGADLLCIDVANGHNQYTIDLTKDIRLRYPNTIIMAANICTADGLIPYAEMDIDCIRIGIGNGSICSTRLQTGVGFGQFSAINEIMDLKVKNNYNIKLISDGGSLGKIGNKTKALSAGANAIMMGRSLACCIESPGMVINRNGKRVKYYRGMASTMASISNNNDNIKNVNKTAEGVDGIIEIKGNISDMLEEISGGIKSGLSYLNCHSLDELLEMRKNNEIRWGLSTSIGLKESGIRIQSF